MTYDHLPIPATQNFTTTATACVTSSNSVTFLLAAPPDDEGLAGVREPRRPHPAAPASSLALDLP
jgi:hypothetical protein